jgi:hypothetical protein
LSSYDSHRTEDIAMLAALLLQPDLNETELGAFSDMHEKLVEGERQALSTKQRAWLVEATKKYGLDAPVDNSNVLRGREVPDPPALQHRPLKPPGRR